MMAGMHGPAAVSAAPPEKAMLMVFISGPLHYAADNATFPAFYLVRAGINWWSRPVTNKGRLVMTVFSSCVNNSISSIIVLLPLLC